MSIFDLEKTFSWCREDKWSIVMQAETGILHVMRFKTYSHAYIDGRQIEKYSQILIRY